MKKILSILKKVFLALILLPIYLFLSTDSYAEENQIELKLETPIIQQTVSAGSTTLASIKLTNSGDVPLKVNSSLKQISSVSNSGRINYIDSAPAFSKWLKFDSTEFTISSGEEKTFAFAFDIPSDVDAGGYYSLISFMGVPENFNKETEFSSIEQSVGVDAVVLLNILDENGIQNYGGITSFSEDGSLFGTHNFDLTYKNAGNFIFIPAGTLKIKNIWGEVIDINNLEDHWLIPDTERNYSFEWFPKNSFGFYTAEIEIKNSVGENNISSLNFYSFCGLGLYIPSILLGVIFAFVLMKIIKSKTV